MLNHMLFIVLMTVMEMMTNDTTARHAGSSFLIKQELWHCNTMPAELYHLQLDTNVHLQTDQLVINIVLY